MKNKIKCQSYYSSSFNAGCKYLAKKYVKYNYLTESGVIAICNQCFDLFNNLGDGEEKISKQEYLNYVKCVIIK